MASFHLLLIAILQGLTEFLPVSSSGHLILLPKLTGLEDQGQTIDVAVHIGTLGAVILYFWRDVRMAVGGVPRMIYGKLDTPGANLAFLLIIATGPVVLFGLMLKLTGLSELMRGSIALIGWTMLGFGGLLWWCDKTGATEKTAENWSLRHAIILGLWRGPGGGADSRHLALGYLHHRRAAFGLWPRGSRQTIDAHVNPDHNRLRGAAERRSGHNGGLRAC